MESNDQDKPVTKRFLREELRGYVTKQAFDTFAANVSARFDTLEQRFDTLITRSDWDKHMEIMDRIMHEVETSRQERILFEKHLLKADDTAHNHEKRIQKLESVVL